MEAKGVWAIMQIVIAVVGGFLAWALGDFDELIVISC
jgi:hypothetical protein